MLSRQSNGFSHDLALFVVSAIWGANFTANKYALGVMAPLVFAGSRFLLASILFFLVVSLLKPGGPVPLRSALLLAALGVVGNTAYQVFFMYGLRTTTAINAALIMAALPIEVAILGIIFKIEQPTRQLWLGMAVAMIGVAIVIAARGASFSTATLRGDLLVLAAVSCWAAFTVGVRRAGRGIHSLRVTAITIYGGTPGLLLLAWPELRATRWDGFGPAAWVALLYSALFAIVLAYALWSYAVQSVGSNRVAIYNCVVPVFAAVVAWLLLGERPSIAQVVGALLVFFGVLVSQRPGAVAIAEP